MFSSFRESLRGKIQRGSKVDCIISIKEEFMGNFWGGFKFGLSLLPGRSLQ